MKTIVLLLVGLSACGQELPKAGEYVTPVVQRYVLYTDCTLDLNKPCDCTVTQEEYPVGSGRVETVKRCYLE